MQLKNKKVVITGASDGIGYEVARLLSAQGARVFSFDIKKPSEKLEGVTFYRVDITKAKTLKKAFKKVGKSVDILINNAGVMRRGKLLESSAKDFDFVMCVNFKGSWLTLKEAEPYLTKQATILQMSSRHGVYPPDDPALYAISKKAVYYMMEILAEGYPSYKIKIACPGSTNTALSRHGIESSVLVKKQKTMDSPESLAEKLVQLIISNKQQLIFQPEGKKYIFK